MTDGISFEEAHATLLADFMEPAMEMGRILPDDAERQWFADRPERLPTMLGILMAGVSDLAARAETPEELAKAEAWHDVRDLLQSFMEEIPPANAIP